MPYSPAQIMLLAIWNGYLEHPGYKLRTFCLRTWTLWNWRFSDGWMFSLKSDLIFGTFISLNLATGLRNNRNGDHHQLVWGPSTWRCVCVCVCLFVFFICVCVCICVLRYAPERRVPHPDTLQLPVDSCIIVGIATGCFFIFGHIFFFYIFGQIVLLYFASSSASAPAVDWEDHWAGTETFLATSLALMYIQYDSNLHKWSW